MPIFSVTYGNGVTDVYLAAEFAFHKAHGKIGTLLGIHPPSRFGESLTEDNAVTRFSAKGEMANSWINAGFFFFRRDFQRYLTGDEELVLERGD